MTLETPGISIAGVFESNVFLGAELAPDRARFYPMSDPVPLAPRLPTNIRSKALEEAARYLEALTEAEIDDRMVERLLTAAEGIRKLKEGG